MTFLRFALLISIIVSYSCTTKPKVVEINVSNPLDIDRKSETVEIDCQHISSLLAEYSTEQIFVTNEAGEVVLSQFIDLDGDQEPDLLIFQADLKANGHQHFHVEASEKDLEQAASDVSTFARFVPERIDDFAWENDRVAFRTYGPKAQAITESGEPGGTLSSGIDCWLKRVEYPIINKWYKQDLEEGLSYHEDHGEGLDNYHVGPSRGTGGIGIWQDGKLAISKNYVSYKIIANGPIRTIFELDYGTWNAGDFDVQEVKRISIDLGTNLFKNTLLIGNPGELPNITLGVTLHDKKGEVKIAQAEGWCRYQEPHFDSELSAAIVVSPSVIKEIIDHRVDKVDHSNLLVVCEPAKELTYYAGFAWGKSNQFDLPDEFDAYLSDFSKRIAAPLKVEIK